MNPSEFLALTARFAERPFPAQVGRHVYLWHGKTEALLVAIPGTALCTLDVHRLAAGLSRAPRSLDAARRLLRRTLRSRLQELVSPHGQQVLVVTGCDLLSRYRVPPALFFEWASERTMIVLILSPDESCFEPPVPLPGRSEHRPAQSRTRRTGSLPSV